MKILNFGSLNIDYVYQMPHFLKPGETLSAEGYHKNAGGKGLNQSVAFARAGAEVYHAGLIGVDGLFLKAFLDKEGVHTDWIKTIEEPTGHAVIQVDQSGQNCILVYPGANGEITEAFGQNVFSAFESGDYVIFQNELNQLSSLLDIAKKSGLKTILNPSPINDDLLNLDFSCVDYFIMNEHEGYALSGKKNPDEILDEMARRYPQAGIVLTMGTDGAYYSDGKMRAFCPAQKVRAVDTTAAGDTFTGYFFASLLKGYEPVECLKRATRASAITVTRPGAAVSIPKMDEI